MGNALRASLWQKALAERARRDRAHSIDAVLARLEQDRLARVREANAEKEARREAARRGWPYPLKSLG